MTVFPAPNGPGTAAVPPFAKGNSASRMRIPVINGNCGINFSRTGRGLLIGHFCDNLISWPSSKVATASFTVKLPSLISFIFPLTPIGTITRCSMISVSFTVPMIIPSLTSCPFFASGTNCHFFFLSSAFACAPRRMKSPISAFRSGSGLCMPS